MTIAAKVLYNCYVARSMQLKGRYTLSIVNLGMLCSVSIPVTIILSFVMLAIGVGSGIGVYVVVMNKKVDLE